MTKSGSDEYKMDLQNINFKEDDIRVRHKFMESVGFEESTIYDK